MRRAASQTWLVMLTQPPARDDDEPETDGEAEEAESNARARLAYQVDENTDLSEGGISTNADDYDSSDGPK